MLALRWPGSVADLAHELFLACVVACLWEWPTAAQSGFFIRGGPNTEGYCALELGAGAALEAATRCATTRGTMPVVKLIYSQWL